jgi:PPM family protein phosphatase
MAPVVARGGPRRWRAYFLRASSADPEVSRPGDVYLLCSDGLSEVLAPAEIAALLTLPPEQACRTLVNAAYEAGSRDNISAIVVRCV